MKRLCFLFLLLPCLAFGHSLKMDADLDIGLFFTEGACGNDWDVEKLGSISWTGKLKGSAAFQPFSWLEYKVIRNVCFGQTHRRYRDESDQLRWAHPEMFANRSEQEHMLKFIINKKWVDPYYLYRSENLLVGEEKAGRRKRDCNIQDVFGYGLAREMINTPDTKLNLRLTATHRIKNEKFEYTFQYPDFFGGFVVTYEVQKRDFGVEWAAEYKQRFNKINGRLRSDLKLYQAFDRRPLREWATRGKQPLEVNWDTDFTIKIWKCLVANLNFALKYDIEEVDKVQWRQMLNLGIGYSLP